MAILFIGGSLQIGPTLGTISNPALSATQLYNAGVRTDGWYYIQTGLMTSSVQVYCNQTDNGGGWMLVSYNPSGSTQLGYPYPNGDSGSLQSGATMIKHYRNAENLWYSTSGSAQCNSVMRMASTSSVDPKLTNCSVAHSVTYTNPNALDISTTASPNTLKNSAPLTGSWSSIKGYTTMTGSLPIAAPCDWLYDTTNWWTVAGPTNAYPDAPYGRSGNAQGTGAWTNRLANQIYGLVPTATTTTANVIRTDLNTVAVYIK